MALSFVPEEHLTLRAGEGAITDYQLKKKVLHRPFCNTCGVNVRCLEGVDAEALPTKHVDGRSH